jgi:hypothetical protein
VALQDGLQAGAQQRDVQIAAQPDHDRQVVERRAGGKLVEEP